MRSIVITGSTRGIGYGLADAFLQLGCAVIISGRKPTSVEEAVTILAHKHEGAAIAGQACDVCRFEEVQALWNAAVQRFGQVDIWINNAGLGQPLAKISQLTPEQLAAIIQTNVLGTLYGSQVAINGLMAQGVGALYNMEGLGSDGRQQGGLAVYGTSKYAVRYINEALAMEVADSPVIVGSLAPGMVVTDLLTAPYANDPEGWERDKRIFNILCDTVETVTPWMAEQILNNQKNGARIQWYSRGKLIGRFLAAPFRQRQVLD